MTARAVLSTYVNCSLGGMTTVFRSRALARPATQFDLVFSVDRGGMSAFADLPNCDVRIVPAERLVEYLRYAIETRAYDLVTVTSSPRLPSALVTSADTTVVYEIHAAVEVAIRKEVAGLELDAVDEIWAPSAWSVRSVQDALPVGASVPVRHVPNIFDAARFAQTGGLAPLRTRVGQVPLLWFGRLENMQKNYSDFLRLLTLLPEAYYGLMVFSLDTDVARLSAVLGSAGLLGVEHRLDIYRNVPQQKVAPLHRAVRDAGGAFCSTALAESFGYGVLEAAACGLPAVGYDVGALAEHAKGASVLVPVGDVAALRDAVREVTRRPSRRSPTAGPLDEDGATPARRRGGRPRRP